MNQLLAVGSIALCLLSASGFGQPTSEVERFAPLRQEAPLEFRYTEVRRMELMDAPWKGSGYLYSTPEGTLVKLQLAPERLIMAIVDETMVYYESATQRRQSAPLSFAGPMAEEVRVFRAIIQGRLAELDAGYAIESSVKGPDWTLRLHGKSTEAGGAPASVEMSGDDRKHKQRILLRQPDGDQTEYLLEQNREGASLELPIRQLVAEAKGK